MTLDEAIKHAEEVAEEKERLTNALFKSFGDYGNIKSSITYEYEKSLKCAKEHLQLAEWLIELKQLKEQEPCEDCISREDLREPRFIIVENDYQKGWNDALNSVYENAPSIQPKKGHWNTYVVNQGGIYEEWLECSECMWSNALLMPRNYCPKCGTRKKVRAKNEANR